jgi:hypothetical protein
MDGKNAGRVKIKSYFLPFGRCILDISVIAEQISPATPVFAKKNTESAVGIRLYVKRQTVSMPLYQGKSKLYQLNLPGN